MKLYKITSLRNGFFLSPKLRLTQRTALNDPFECLPSTEQVADLYARIFSEFKRSGHDISGFERIGDFINSSEVEKLYDYTRLNDHYGIISLCQELHSIIMWSHYGNMHKGIAIEVDSRKLLIKNTLQHSQFYTSPKTNPQPVVYSKSRKIDDPGSFSFNHLYDSFFLKSDEWSYEKEFRIVSDLSNADEVIITEEVWSTFNKELEHYVKFFKTQKLPDGKLQIKVSAKAYQTDNKMTFGDNPDKMRRNLITNTYAYWAKFPSSIFLCNIPINSITKIYLGCSISSNDREQINLELENHRYKPEIVQLKRHKNKFEITT